MKRITKWIEEKAGNGSVGYLDEVILEIGRNTYTRRQLTRLGCPFFRAASILNGVLAQFEPRSVKELAARVDLFDIRRKGVGERTVILWLYLLDSVGVDSMRWLNTDLKIPTLCAKKRLKQRS